MKKTTIILLTVCTLLFSFNSIIDKVTATTDQINGMQIFCFSKPVTKYDILGTVKIPGVCSSYGEKRTEILTQRAKKDFPSGEAIIINSTFEKAEVIKFKD